MLERILRTTAPAAVIVIRFLLGTVFLSEGIQKFLFPNELGVGRFAKIGIPSPEVMAPFVGTFEIVGGALLLLGLATRIAAVPLFVIMLVAIATTKLSLLTTTGFWNLAHEARTDWSMLLCLVFVFLVGAGRWSLDQFLTEKCVEGRIAQSRSGEAVKKPL